MSNLPTPCWLSIIIPTYHEAENLKRLLPHLRHGLADAAAEILVVDAGSEDNTLAVARQYGADIAVVSPKPGRAAQMNHGAQLAQGELLYFVHADSVPPPSFVEDLRAARRAGHEMGCYRFKFDREHPILRINAFCTRFPLLIFRGGDQSLFITRQLFDTLGGYTDDFQIMEEYDLMLRAKAHTRFHIMPGEITVSARKYASNSFFRVNFANLVVFTLFFLGASQRFLFRTYRTLLRHR